MSTHDPLCPGIIDGPRDCLCPRIAKVRADEREQIWRVEQFIDVDGYPSMTVVKGELVGENEWAASIRADALADAESVAAKLVEVICEQEEIIAGERMLARAAIKACNGLGRERDAARVEVEELRATLRAESRLCADARAEVDRLTIEIGKVVDSRERTRVEMGQKVIDANREAALARAEVAALRDDPSGENWPLLRELWLREVLADLRAKVEGLHHDGLCSVTAQMASCDCLRADVLALIDGAR